MTTVNSGLKGLKVNVGLLFSHSVKYIPTTTSALQNNLVECSSGRILVTIYGVPRRRFLEFSKYFRIFGFFPQVLFSLILRCGTHLSFR